MRFLVVDDNATVRRVVAEYLRSGGDAEVHEAGDGREAVGLVERNRYDLVLMDWNMPNMHGIDALKAMRAAGSRVPVLMITTEGSKERILEALTAGATGYAVKPFTKELLLSRVSRVLSASPAGATGS